VIHAPDPVHSCVFGGDIQQSCPSVRKSEIVRWALAGVSSRTYISITRIGEAHGGSTRDL
jgi:hypothetical protein